MSVSANLDIHKLVTSSHGSAAPDALHRNARAFSLYPSAPIFGQLIHEKAILLLAGTYERRQLFHSHHHIPRHYSFAESDGLLNIVAESLLPYELFYLALCKNNLTGGFCYQVESTNYKARTLA